MVLITISFGALFEAYWFNWDYRANTNNYLESAELQNKVLTAYENIDQVYNFYQSRRKYPRWKCRDRKRLKGL